MSLERLVSDLLQRINELEKTIERTSKLTSGRASETLEGTAEIATQLEIGQATDNQRFVTPLKLSSSLTDSYPLTDASKGDHFRDNDASFPAGWTEIDAASSTDTNSIYSMWRLRGTNVDTSWKYRKQSGITLESLGSGVAATIYFGQIMFMTRVFTADVDYYFGMYRDNSGIDEATYSRVHLQWDNAGSQWRVRGEESDGTVSNNGSWFTLPGPPFAPVHFRVSVLNNAAKRAIQFFADGAIPSLSMSYSDYILQNVLPTTAPTWGQFWVQIHQSRGTGGEDEIFIGVQDYWEGIDI